MGIKQRIGRIIALTAAGMLAVAILVGSLLYSRRTGGDSLYIAEVCASNELCPNDDGFCLDYIEIGNASDQLIDLSSYRLLCGKGSFSFPKGTQLSPGECLVVWCGDQGETNFAVSRQGGERIAILNSFGFAVDEMETVPTGKNEAMVRIKGADGKWNIEISGFLTPGLLSRDTGAAGTIGTEAQPSANHEKKFSPVRLNEVMTSNGSYPDDFFAYYDYVELYNTSGEAVDIGGYSLSDDPDKTGQILPQGTVIEGNGYLVICCERDTNFALSKEGGETLVWRDALDRQVDFTLLPSLGTDESWGIGNDGTWQLMDEGTPGFVNSAEGREAYLRSLGVEPGTIVISEVMPDNHSICLESIATEEAFVDWIELTNLGSFDVELSGWYLSDDLENPQKQSLIGKQIKAGEALAIPCEFGLSGRQESLWLTAPGEYLCDAMSYGTEETPAPTENHSLHRPWQEAVAEETEAPELAESFQETPYPTPGEANTKEGYERSCLRHQVMGDLAIWEVMTANDWYLPEGGAYFDWAEIRNVSDHEVELSDFALSDDAEIPDQYRLKEKVLAPGEVYVLIFDGEGMEAERYEHVPFALSAKEENLYLFRVDDTGEKGSSLSDSVWLYDLPYHKSCGRSEQAEGFFYMEPTPGEDNIPEGRRVSEEPTADVPSGVYDAGEILQVELSGCGKVYYTLDCSIPTAESLPAGGPIEVTKTTIIRAVNIEPGCSPSDILTLSYIVGEGDTVPVVSLVTDPKDMFGDDGIYKSAWAIKEIEKPASISYFGEDGTFSTDCGISMHGMTSLHVSPKKSFTVRFKNVFDGPLDYDLFENGEITQFRSIMLRADVEDAYPSYIRDALFGRLALEYSDTCYGMDYKYSALYLNGEFWGMYVIREHPSPEYYAEHTGYPVDSCSMIKSYALPGDDLYDIIQWAKKHGLSDPENYAYICSVVDVESFADWIILEAYTGNIDINGNMRYFYSSEDGLWRCCIYDVDLGMMDTKTFDAVFYSMQGALPYALIQNDDFCQLLTERLSYYLADPLSTEAMQARIDEMAAELRDQMPKEDGRWNYPTYVWESFIADLKRYCKDRPEDMVYGWLGYHSMTQEEIEIYFPWME